MKVKVALSGIAVSFAVAADARFEDFIRYEIFDASMACGVCSVLQPGAMYPESMIILVPFEGQELVLDLKMSGDATAMCHYTGVVVGEPSSFVKVSVCSNDAGIKGQIHTEDFSAEIQPMDPTASIYDLGNHIIYNVDDRVFTGDVEFVENSRLEQASSSANASKIEVSSSSANDSKIGIASVGYVNTLVFSTGRMS
jgi:hypothetical protein